MKGDPTKVPAALGVVADEFSESGKLTSSCPSPNSQAGDDPEVDRRLAAVVEENRRLRLENQHTRAYAAKLEARFHCGDCTGWDFRPHNDSYKSPWLIVAIKGFGLLLLTVSLLLFSFVDHFWVNIVLAMSIIFYIVHFLFSTHHWWLEGDCYLSCKTRFGENCISSFKNCPGIDYACNVYSERPKVLPWPHKFISTYGVPSITTFAILHFEYERKEKLDVFDLLYWIFLPSFFLFVIHNALYPCLLSQCICEGQPNEGDDQADEENQADKGDNQAESNTNQPESNTNQPESNPNQPESSTNQPESNPNQPESNTKQPESNNGDLMVSYFFVIAKCCCTRSVGEAGDEKFELKCW